MDKYFFDVFVGIVGTAFLAQPIFLVMVGLKLDFNKSVFSVEARCGCKVTKFIKCPIIFTFNFIIFN